MLTDYPEAQMTTKILLFTLFFTDYEATLEKKRNPEDVYVFIEGGKTQTMMHSEMYVHSEDQSETESSNASSFPSSSSGSHGG